MKFGRIIVLALAPLLLGACGDNSSNQPKLMKEQREALDKAKGVEGTLKQQADEQKKEADKQAQ